MQLTTAATRAPFTSEKLSHRSDGGLKDESVFLVLLYATFFRQAQTMVSLYITPVGNRLNAARDANDAYWRLARVGFLSVRALLNRAAVVSLIEQIEADFYKQPVSLGSEAWPAIESALDGEDYLSVIGRTLGRRDVRRSRGW